MEILGDSWGDHQMFKTEDRIGFNDLKKFKILLLIPGIFLDKIFKPTLKDVFEFKGQGLLQTRSAFGLEQLFRLVFSLLQLFIRNQAEFHLFDIQSVRHL